MAPWFIICNHCSTPSTRWAKSGITTPDASSIWWTTAFLCLKTNTNNINYVNHSLDKLHIRLFFFFYGNIYETLPETMVFICWKPEKMWSVFCPWFRFFVPLSISKNRGRRSGLDGSHFGKPSFAWQQHRNIYKSHLSLKEVIKMVFLEKICLIPFRIIFLNCPKPTTRIDWVLPKIRFGSQHDCFQTTTSKSLGTRIQQHNFDLN